MRESFRDLLYRNHNHWFTEDLLQIGLMQDNLRRGWDDGTSVYMDESRIFRVPSKQAYNPPALVPTRQLVSMLQCPLKPLIEILSEGRSLSNKSGV
ncbi:hypothetical protein GB937_007574 [Aspergillus fischeri]|nr:hypothetical protein GB937_007574 [Aspergillus fischeri]